jgi:polyketide synthase PksN
MHGPALSVDTACSSSIVSSHLAATALWGGEVDRAAAAGAHSIVESSATATFFAAGMLSPASRCRTMVGQRTITLSAPVLKPPMVSAIAATM